MSALRRMLQRLWHSAAGRSDDVRFQEELEDHVHRQIEENRRAGLPSEEARRQALLKFGPVEAIRDSHREEQRLPLVDHVFQDVLYAFRQLRQPRHGPMTGGGMRQFRTVLRQRSYLMMMVSTLGLAVGVNLVVFTIVNALWFKKPAFPNVDRTVVVLGDESAGGIGSGAAESRLFTSLDLLDRSGAFDVVAGQVATSGPTHDEFLPRLQFQPFGEDLETLGVTPTYFDVLGLTIVGRTFSETDDRPGGEAVAIISDQLWTRYFDRRPDVIGAVVRATPFGIRIIGVAPAGFHGARLGERTDAWITRSLAGRLSSASAVSPPLLALALLREGVTIAEAERRIENEAGPVYRNRGIRHSLVPITDVFGSPSSKTLVVRERDTAALVTFLSGLVLLAGAATLTALVLVHYERRRQELSLRLAIGASRARLVTQLACELLLLVVMGCTVATVAAAGGLRALPALSLPGGADLARLDLSIDWRVLALGVLLSVTTVGLAALVPVRRFTRGDLARDLVTAAGTMTMESHRLRRTLLGFQVAATVVVLMTAALFTRAVMAGFSDGPGFDVDRTLFVRVPLVRTAHGVTSATSLAQGTALMERFAQTGPALVASVASLPGVNSVNRGAAPIGPEAARLIQRQSVVTDDGERLVSLAMLRADPEYFRTLGVPMMLGRTWTVAEMTARPAPAVVTASFADALWPGRSPLGQTFAMPLRGGTYTVIGVAADFRFGSASGETTGVAATPPAAWDGLIELAVHAERPETLVEAIRQRIVAVEPDVGRIDVVSGRDLIARDLGRQRLGAWFFSGFGLVTFALAVGGVFGLVSYLAEARRREFAVRLALGATSIDLVRRAVSTTLIPIAVGSACGLLAAAALARSFAALLVGVSPLDPLSYVVVGALMVGSAILAGLLAAWRLHGLSPSAAFRSE